MIYLSIFLLFVGVVGYTAQAQTSSKEAGSREKLNVKKLDVTEFFSNENGTFLLRNVKTGKTFVYNQERATTRLTLQNLRSRFLMH